MVQTPYCRHSTASGADVHCKCDIASRESRLPHYVLSQQEWPQMDNLIARWTTMLTAKETMTNPTVHGAVQANVASSQMQRRKPVHRNAKCINCGKPGPMYAQCEETVSKCAKCSGSHHTTMHEEVQSLRKARDERAGKAKPKLPDINSPKERFIF